jgi:hypothetical protein
MKKGENSPIVVVGNKRDLENERVFRPEEIERFTKEWGCPYIETSAAVYFYQLIID